MDTRIPCLDGDTVTLPNKGDYVYVEHFYEAALTCLAGMQMKMGAREIPATEGVMMDVYGEYRDGATWDQAKSGAVKPNAVTFVILPTGATDPVEVTLALSSLKRVAFVRAGTP